MRISEIEARIAKLVKLENPTAENVLPELEKLGINVTGLVLLARADGATRWVVMFRIPSTHKAHINSSVGATFALKALTGGPVEVKFAWKGETLDEVLDRC